MTVLLISSIGSLFNVFYWYINEQVINDPSLSWNQDFSWYLGIFIFSVILSFASSFLILLITWFVENIRRRFTLLIHFLFPMTILLILLIGKAHLENYIHFLCYYLPGIFGYYHLVYRKKTQADGSDLLDQL
ncbi:MAG: hypothetical protein ACK457_09490 [Flavobacteriia bacterium]